MFRQLMPFVRPAWPLLLGSAVLAIPVAALRVGPIPLIQRFIDELVVTRDASKLVLFPVLIVGMFTINFFVRFFHTYLLKLSIAMIDRKLKNDLHAHLIGLSAGTFSQQRSGALISSVTYDTVYISVGLQAMNAIIREPITLVFLLGYTLFLNWKLTLIYLTLVPSLLWFLKRSSTLFRNYVNKLSKSYGDLTAELSEGFAGIRTIKVFQLEKYVRKKFRKNTGHLNRITRKIALIEEVSHPFLDLLHSFALAAVFYFGGKTILENAMSPGDLIAFCVAFAGMTVPVRGLSEVNTRLSQMSAAVDRISGLFKLKPSVQESPSPRPVLGLKNGIQLSGVGFAYPDEPGRMVLENVTLNIPKGSTTAFVGASGSGKSSLVQLLPRLFDVTEGQIFWDGIDIRDLKLDDLRRQIAIVSQDVFLFHDTIEENIRCGRLTASHADIRNAASKAQLLTFIESLPLGFKTLIGERGQRLSGGERQRIAIARAFLRDAPVLILDEATSSLDATNERAIQGSLQDLAKDRTTIVVAHRLSTIRTADSIVVISNGRVLEHGTHDSLLKRAGAYAQFHADLRDRRDTTGITDETLIN